MVTEREISSMKIKLTEIRDRLIQGKATYEEVMKSINACIVELDDLNLGISVYKGELEALGMAKSDIFAKIYEKISNQIAMLEDEIKEEYDLIAEKVEKWSKV